MKILMSLSLLYRKILLLACILTIGVLTSCGSNSTNNNKIIINFWDQEDGAAVQNIIVELVSEFNALSKTSNYNIQINHKHYQTEELREKFLEDAKNGKAPEIVLGPNDNLGVLVPSNAIIPINYLFENSYIYKFDTKALALATYWKKQFMLPDRKGNEVLLIYNKDLVSKAPETFKELIKITKKLQSAKKVKYGLVFFMSEPFFTIPFFGAYGGRVFDDELAINPKPTLNTEATKKWMKFLLSLKNNKVIPENCNYQQAEEYFTKKQAAFYINGPWAFAGLQKSGINFGISYIPTIDGRYPKPYTAVKGYCFSKSIDSVEKKEAVKKFIKFMLKKENQIRMTRVHYQLPSLLTAMQDKFVNNNYLVFGQKEQLDKCIPMPIISQMRAIWDSIRPVQAEVLAGKISPEKAAEKMQALAEEKIGAL